jgi:hypothetical protein
VSLRQSRASEERSSTPTFRCFLETHRLKLVANVDSSVAGWLAAIMKGLPCVFEQAASTHTVNFFDFFLASIGRDGSENPESMIIASTNSFVMRASL